MGGSAFDEDDVHAEDFLEHLAFDAEGAVFEVEVFDAGDADEEGVLAAFAEDGGDGAAAGAREGVGDAEDGGELLDGEAVAAGEGLVVGVCGFGRGAAVVAGDVGDDAAVAAAEAEDGLVGEDVHGVFVVAGGGDEGADFVEPAGDFEEDAVSGAEAVFGGEGVEDLEGEGGDFAAVVFVDAVFASELEGGVEHLGDVARGPGVFLGDFLEEAVAHGEAADVEGFAADVFGEAGGCVEGGGEGFGFGEGEVVGFDGVFDGGADEFIGDAFPVFEGDGLRCGAVPFGVDAHGGEAGVAAEDDEVLGAFFEGGAELVEGVGDFLVEDIADEGEGGALLVEEVAEAEGAEAEDAGVDDGFAGEGEEFGAAAADFDEEGVVGAFAAAAEEGEDAEVGEAGGFGVVDDFDFDAGGEGEAVDEGIAVGGLLDGGGGDGADVIGGDAVFAHDLLEAFEDADAFLDGVAADASFGEDVLAEADGLVEFFEEVDLAVGGDVGEGHADAGGADVDDGDGAGGGGG